MQEEVDDVVRADLAAVTAIFRADRYHQLASTGLDPELSGQLADVQLRGWTLMIEDAVRPEYLAVYRDGTPIAGAVVSRGRRRRITWIGVHPDHRRRGHGRTVLGAVCARADRDGKVLELQVDGANLGARALYDEAGFRENESDESTDHFLVREPRRSTT